MKVEKLSDLKKELKSLNSERLVEICLKLSKYKKENKELLSYLLFDSTNPFLYAENVKEMLKPGFLSLSRPSYTSTKEIRKIIRLITKHAKYTGSKEVETELLLWFCEQFLEYADTRTHHKPLLLIFSRQIEKIKRILPKLHEDFQFDFGTTYTQIIQKAGAEMRFFDKSGFEL